MRKIKTSDQWKMKLESMKEDWFIIPQQIYFVYDGEAGNILQLKK